MRTLIFLSIFLITACTSVNEQTKMTTMSDNLIAIKWQVIEIKGEPLIDESALYLVISADGKVTGNAGVNNYFGNWILSNNMITSSTMAATKMFRVNPVGIMEQEKQYLQLLSEVSRWHVSTEELQLFQDNKIILKFRHQGVFKSK